MYTLPTKDAIYFLWKNLKKQKDTDLIKQMKKYKDKKKKYKEAKKKGENAKKPLKPEISEGIDLKT